jgi:hypothetical protein
MLKRLGLKNNNNNNNAQNTKNQPKLFSKSSKICHNKNPKD